MPYLDISRKSTEGVQPWFFCGWVSRQGVTHSSILIVRVATVRTIMYNGNIEDHNLAEGLHHSNCYLRRDATILFGCVCLGGTPRPMRSFAENLQKGSYHASLVGVHRGTVQPIRLPSVSVLRRCEPSGGMAIVRIITPRRVHTILHLMLEWKHRSIWLCAIGRDASTHPFMD